MLCAAIYLRNLSAFADQATGQVSGPLSPVFSAFLVKSRLESAASIVSLLQLDGWLGSHVLRIGISCVGDWIPLSMSTVPAPRLLI